MRERVEDLGRLREKLENIIDMEIFDNHFLSKHNIDYWYPSELEMWKENREALILIIEDRLDECRRKLMYIGDLLLQCFEIAKGDEEIV